MKFTTKNIFISLIALTVFTSFIISKAPKSKVNIYKDDKDVHHSLFREQDDPERMSYYYQGVPPPKAQK